MDWQIMNWRLQVIEKILPTALQRKTHETTSILYNILDNILSVRPPLRKEIIGSGLVVLLAGCAQTPMSVGDMSDKISAELAAASTNSTEPVAVSGGFAVAIAQAVETNAGYRASLSREREATSMVGVAESVRKPQMGVNANLGGLREFDAAGDAVTGIGGGFNLSQLIYDGGESLAAVNRVTAEALEARAERVASANALALEVARAWIDVWQFEERVRLLRSRTSEMDVMVGQMERMAANGYADRAALDRARRQIVDVRLEETRLQSDLADAKVRFRRYFRQQPEKLGRPAEIVTPVLARAQEKAWKKAPSLEARAAGLIAARHGVEEAQAALGPRIRLQTGLITPLDKAEGVSGNIGFGFDYSFFDGKRRVHQLEASIARQMALEDQFYEEATTIQAELAASLARLSGLERSMPLVVEQVRLSASEAETARSQIATGQATLRQMVEAEVENYRAIDREVTIRAERHLLLLTIAARTGELGRLLGLRAEVSPKEH